MKKLVPLTDEDVQNARAISDAIIAIRATEIWGLWQQSPSTSENFNRFKRIFQDVGLL